MVKKTVNQDDTSCYHLFYGDEQGNPGTELTFFDIPHLAPTHPGTGSISSVSLRVKDREALHYWADRFDQLQVDYRGISDRGGRDGILFRDFEGQRLALVVEDENGVPGGRPWEKSPVPVEHGILGLGPVMLSVAEVEPTLRMLLDVLGFRPAGEYSSPDAGQPDIRVFATGDGGPGAEVHVEERPDLPRERLGRGGVHHMAFRVLDDQQYEAWLERLNKAGVHHSGPIDRYYFRSIYFREPNGILFELATDGPGFVIDEDPDHLGEKLALPPVLEPRREKIESRLRPLA